LLNLNKGTCEFFSQIGRGSYLSSLCFSNLCLDNDVASATTNINLQCLSERMPCVQIRCTDCKDYSISALRERVIHFEILKTVKFLKNVDFSNLKEVLQDCFGQKLVQVVI